MPTYDFDCAACGRTTVARRGWDTRSIPCLVCGAAAPRRAVNLVGTSGFAFTPYNQRRVHLDRAINAQHELIHQAEKHGKMVPDLLAMSKRKAAAIRASGEQVEVGNR